MAGYDNVLFAANVSSGAAAGTVIPLSLMYGIENVRQGYGTPVLKSARAMYAGVFSSPSGAGIPVEIKNSNWIDGAGLVAQYYGEATALNRDSYSFMRGRDKILAPNTSWSINATLTGSSNAAGTIYVLLEIAYSDVPGIDTEAAAGSPVYKHCANAAVTVAANTVKTIGTFDNLLQNVSYVLSEVASVKPNGGSDPLFVILEGFSNQKGLTRIIPTKCTGLCDQIKGSVTLTKQTYNVSIISYAALSAAAVDIGLELIASNN